MSPLCQSSGRVDEGACPRIRTRPPDVDVDNGGGAWRWDVEVRVHACSQTSSPSNGTSSGFIAGVSWLAVLVIPSFEAVRS